MASGESWQSDLESFTVKGFQQALLNKNFALYMITSETPFLRANNPYLRKAIGILGGRVPDEGGSVPPHYSCRKQAALCACDHSSS